MNSIETASSALARTDELEPLLTVRAVCRVLGISKPTLYRLIHSGELMPVRVSKSPRFLPADIRAYLERQREAGP
jgi:excisionase family DNA binding protein